MVWPPIIFRPEGLKSCDYPKTRGHARKTVKNTDVAREKTVYHFGGGGGDGGGGGGGEILEGKNGQSNEAHR